MGRGEDVRCLEMTLIIGALKDQLCTLARRWLIDFGYGAVTEGMDEASWEWGVKEGRNGKAADHLMTEW